MDANEIILEPASEQFSPAIPELVFTTGTVAYGHVFGHNRDLFDAFILESWTSPLSLYSWHETTIARDGDRLLGIEMGYGGQRYYELDENGTNVGGVLLESGKTTREKWHAVGVEGYKMSFQIPYIPANAYYVMALSVTEDSRGRGIGAKLLENAFDRAKESGYRTLHLDVLADNPAVDFYKRMGMTCMAESSVPELREHGIPAEYRMVKRLS